MTGRILELGNVVAAGSATTKLDAIREAGALLVTAGAVRADYVDSMFDREAGVSTYVGNFLAIPHGTHDATQSIVRSALSLVRYAEPIDWNGRQVRFVVGIAGRGNEHLEILQKIATVFLDEFEVQKLIDAATAEDIYMLLEEFTAE